MASMRKLRRDAGVVTAEYAVALMAGVAFAGLLIKVVTSGPVNAALTRIVQAALSVAA
jgi:hypothetical protein